MSLSMKSSDFDAVQAQRDLAFAEHRLSELKAQCGVMNRAGEPVPERLKREKIVLKREIHCLLELLGA